MQGITVLLMAASAAAVIIQYRRSETAGLGLAFFLLVSLPDSITLSLPDGLPNVTIHRVLLTVLLIHTLRRPEKRVSLLRSTFGLVLFCMGLSLIGSTLLSPFPLVSAKRLLYFLLEGLGTFWIVRASVRSTDEGHRLLNWIGSGFALVAILAIIERYSGWRVNDLFPHVVDTARFTWLTVGADTSLTSTYPHRILLGLACALGALKYVQDLILDKRTVGKLSRLVGAAVCIAALYFAMSRGPWLAFALSFAILMLVTGIRALKWAVLLGAMIATVMIVRPGVWATVAGLEEATLDPNSVKGSSFEWRFVVVDTALSEMRKAGILNKIFGFGGGSQIMNDFGKFQIAPDVWVPIESWDCEYAIVLYDKGWLGLLLILLLTSTALTRLGFATLRCSPDDPSRYVLVGSFVCLLCLAFARTNVAFFAPQLTYAEMAYLGLGSVFLDRSRIGAKTARGTRSEDILRVPSGAHDPRGVESRQPHRWSPAARVPSRWR
jgi:hypothetical protein